MNAPVNVPSAIPLMVEGIPFEVPDEPRVENPICPEPVLFDNVIDIYFPPKNKVTKHPKSYTLLEKKSYTIYLSPFFIKDTPNILNIIEKRNLILEQKWKIGDAEILKNYHFVFNHKFGSIKWDTIRQESRLVNYLQLSIPLVDKLSFYNIFSKNKKLLTYLPKTFINIKNITKIINL